MFEQPVPAGVVRPEQAPHTFGEQTEQAIHAYREGMMAIEHTEPSRVSDPGAPRVPYAERDLASEQAQTMPPTTEDIDPEMTIAWGEDPGWSNPELLSADAEHGRTR